MIASLIQALRDLVSRNLFATFSFGVGIAIVSVVLASIATLVDPLSVTFGQAETDFQIGSVHSREEGEASERRARETMRKAEAFARSPERRAQRLAVFKRNCLMSVGAMVFLGGLILRPRGVKKIALFGLPSVLLASFLLLA